MGNLSSVDTRLLATLGQCTEGQRTTCSLFWKRRRGMWRQSELWLFPHIEEIYTTIDFHLSSCNWNQTKVMNVYNNCPVWWEKMDLKKKQNIKWKSVVSASFKWDALKFLSNGTCKSVSTNHWIYCILLRSCSETSAKKIKICHCV